MTRISQDQIGLSLINYINNNRTVIDKLNQEISSGYAVANPGDSTLAGTITQFQNDNNKVDSYTNTITTTTARLSFQDNVMSQVNDLLTRAKEIATQASNETNDPTTRAAMAAEVMQIRDHVASLANSQYEGKYIYNGLATNVQPYTISAYANPASGLESQHYSYNTATPGSTSTNSVNLTDNLTITTNTPGNKLFDNAINGLEILGRSLAGYKTTVTGGVITGAGVAYNFPTEYSTQTADIKAAMDQLDTARTVDVADERTDLAGREERIKTAQSLLSLTKGAAQDALNKYQNVDTVAAATQLTQAQTALQASLTVSVKVLGLNILPYI